MPAPESESDESFLLSLESQGVSRKFAQWAIAYLRTGNLDYQSIDISAYVDRTLTYSEQKTAFKQQFPISNLDIIAQDQASKIQEDALTRKINEQYEEEIKQQETEKLESLKDQPFCIARYTKTLKTLIKNVAEGYNTSLFVVSSEVGIGKSYTLHTTMQELGLEIEKDYAYFSGYVTPLSIYEFMYANKDRKIIVFDDIDQCYKNAVTLGLLKSATHSPIGIRKVQYLTTSKAKTAPDEFVLNANVIFIANRVPDNTMIKALVDRALYYEITLTQSEKKEVAADFSKLPYKTLTRSERKEVFAFLMANNPDAIKNFNFRLIEKCYNLFLQFKEQKQKQKSNDSKNENLQRWEDAAKAIIMYDEDILSFIEAEKQPLTKLAIEKFEELTGLGRRSYFYTKRRYYKQIVQSANEHRTA